MVSTIVTQPSKLSLERFLELPETEPAREYIDGVITQKPMPKGTHSRLQAKLVSVINQIVEAEKIAYAFPELRCTFGGRSIVLDLAVFTWDRIPFTSTGRVPENFVLPPDWAIEILSPDQSPNLVIGKLLHCIQPSMVVPWVCFWIQRMRVFWFSKVANSRNCCGGMLVCWCFRNLIWS